MRSQALLSAAALGLASLALPAAPAYARDGEYYRYSDRAPISEECRDDRKDNTKKGALLGGAIGAAAGAGAAGRGSRGTGALLGGALGAGVGALAGRGATSCDNFEREAFGRDDFRRGRGRDCYLEEVIRYDRRGRKYYDMVEICDRR